MSAAMALVNLGDGPTGLITVDAGSVDLVLSDLPSGQTAAVFDVKPDLPVLWSAIWHALKPSGLAVLMASSLKFAAELLESERKRFRYDMVWEKSHAVGFLNSKRAPLRAHEFVLVFSRQTGTYNPQMLTGYGPIRANRQPLLDRATVQISESYGRAREGGGHARAGAPDRYPRSVIREDSVPRGAWRYHPQQKPQALLRRLIRQYTNPGELVADPFAGSGSTGAAAEAEGRRYRCWDSDPRFGRLFSGHQSAPPEAVQRDALGHEIAPEVE